MKDEPAGMDHSKIVKRKCVVVFLTLFIMIAGVLIALAVRFLADKPVDYADDRGAFQVRLHRRRARIGVSLLDLESAPDSL